MYVGWDMAVCLCCRKKLEKTYVALNENHPILHVCKALYLVSSAQYVHVPLSVNLWVPTHFEGQLTRSIWDIEPGLS